MHILKHAVFDIFKAVPSSLISTIDSPSFSYTAKSYKIVLNMHCFKNYNLTVKKAYSMFLEINYVWTKIVSQRIRTITGKLIGGGGVYLYIHVLPNRYSF